MSSPNDEISHFIVHDTISAADPNGYSCNANSHRKSPTRKHNPAPPQGRKKKRIRRGKASKNKEEEEKQRMTHIEVERNRRKQMNQHLSDLRALMPQSYVLRGDQASIVGGAIEYVKELEHHLQSLQAHKLQLLQTTKPPPPPTTTNAATGEFTEASPMGQFLGYNSFDHCTWPYQNQCTSKSKAAVANVEVTLIETYANLRILTTKSLRQLSKMVVGLQSLYLTILHLNMTTLDPLVLYSISVKVEEESQMSSADDIASAVHHVLRIIEDEAVPYVHQIVPPPFILPMESTT